jgi:hypothetical protein
MSVLATPLTVVLLWAVLIAIFAFGLEAVPDDSSERRLPPAT